MKVFLIILAFCFSNLAFAQENENVRLPTPTPRPVPAVSSKKSDSVTETPVDTKATVRDFRSQSQWTVTGNWSYLDMWMPSKIGFTIGYLQDPQNTYELDYMRGSFGLGWMGLDIGGFTDQRLSLIWRTYAARNSLNFQWGVNYNKIDVQVGSQLLSKIAAQNTQYSLIELETLGLTWGLGNRWQTKGGFVWSVDWFQVNLPLLILKSKAPFVDATPDARDRDNAQNAINLITRIPRLVAFKVQLGLAF